MAEVLLDMRFLDLRRRGEPGAQQMIAEGAPSFTLRQLAANAGGERRFLHQTGDVFVVSRSAATPPFLRATGRNNGPWLIRPRRIQVSSRATGQVREEEPRPISTSRQPVLPLIVNSRPPSLWLALDISATVRLLALDASAPVAARSWR
jgi:hypothetical protein